jgi:[NiFe] hydrogenase diaphorase moiety large subunit
MNPPSGYFEALLARHGHAPHRLVQILREVQTHEKWLSRDTLSAVAAALKLPLAHVEGVAGFYHFFYDQPVGQYRVLFSDNITDRMRGSEEMERHLRHLLKLEPNKMRADGRVSVSTTSCTGLCDQGPAALINHHQIVTRLTPKRIEHMAALIERQVPVEQWPSEWSRVDDQIRRADVKLGEQPFPGQAIAAAIARGPQGMLDDLKRSKLRGRGGAGYATGTKWQLCRNARSDTHYVVCNADEGEPGTFKDRVLLSSYADTIFEGMTIAAFVIGARRGLMYLRGEYRYLLEPLLAAIERRKKQGSVG